MLMKRSSAGNGLNNLEILCRKEATRLSSSSEKKSMTIGVLGLQGDVEENVAATNQACKNCISTGMSTWCVT